MQDSRLLGNDLQVLPRNLHPCCPVTYTPCSATTCRSPALSLTLFSTLSLTPSPNAMPNPIPQGYP